jgi:hypothetical protein
MDEQAHAAAADGFAPELARHTAADVSRFWLAIEASRDVVAS